MKRYKLLKDLPLYPAETICMDGKLYIGGADMPVIRKDGDPTNSPVIMRWPELSMLKDRGEFDKWFEEFEESKVWTPTIEEHYYYMDGIGCANFVYHDGNTSDDYTRFEMGNCFKTEEDVEKAVKKLKALRRLREKGLVFNDWENVAGGVTIRADLPSTYDEEEEKSIERDLDLLFKED